VVCLSPPDDYSDKLVRELGCEWRPLAMNNQGSNPFSEAGLVYRFWRHYRRIRPVAALHFTIKNNVYGTWAAAALNIPAINNVSGLGTAFIRKGLVSSVVRLLYRTSQPLAYRVFCQNEEDRAQLVESGLVPTGRLELLPGSGVDLTRFSPGLKRAHGGPMRFLYAGRMLYDKGLRELVTATRAINRNGIRCHVWLCGFAGVDNVSAIPQDQLDRWGEEPGASWLGPSDTMEKLYAQVDCVVLPSYREGMPRSLLEAGAMGLPVIASDVPGCRNIVRDGDNGLLCAARDSRSLRAAMERMLAMTDRERADMGARGRALVCEKFDEALVIGATLRAVESAIATR
jgi:glycosyltransferase involved in cell wall biosynthesis